jgi:hypothetical protein
MEPHRKGPGSHLLRFCVAGSFQEPRLFWQTVMHDFRPIHFNVVNRQDVPGEIHDSEMHPNSSCIYSSNPNFHSLDHQVNPMRGATPVTPFSPARGYNPQRSYYEVGRAFYSRE